MGFIGANLGALRLWVTTNFNRLSQRFPGGDDHLVQHQLCNINYLVMLPIDIQYTSPRSHSDTKT